ncbi:unnamed protein product, partial [marine sediment metagenome]
ELADYVLAAALLAQGQVAQALSALEGAKPSAGRLGITVPSCLFATNTRYWVDRRLGEVAQVAVAAPSPQPRPQGAVAILSPSPGSVVHGLMQVQVQLGPEVAASYVAVLLDGKFCGISNVQPFSIRVDSRRVSDGIQALRADAYSTAGVVVASITINVRVDNGQQTLAPSERATRQAADRFLQRALTLRLPPLAIEHLRGRLLEQTGNSQAALAAYEYAFSYAPGLPLLRTDLLRACQRAGLEVPSLERDIHRLG